MKLLFVSLVFPRCSMMIGQTVKGFDIQGVLKLIDRAPTAIPIEGLVFHIHPLKGGLDIEARPDRAGRFTLNKVHPGPYSLTFPTPSRIQSFRYGSSELAADRFELTAGSAGVLTLVISDQSADLFVKIQGLAAGQSNVVALLAPADSHLTQRTSCYLNQLSGSQTTFTFIPLGKYRVFVFDAQFQSDVSAYAPLPGFLKNEAASVEVSDDQTADTAFYLEEGTVKNAIQQMRLSVHVNTR